MARHYAIWGGVFARAAVAASVIGTWSMGATAQCPEWRALSSGGQSGVNGNVHALAVWNGDLYAGGSFTAAGGQTVNGIARWDGAAWHPLGFPGDEPGVTGTVHAITVWNDQLIVGGNFDLAGGVPVNNLARWSGTIWSAFLAPGPHSGVDDTVAALTVHQGDLVIGGHFDTAGGVTVNGIARWTGSTWQPFLVAGEIGLSGSVRSFVTWNGDLVVGGDFMEAGGLTVRSIARWTGAAWQPFSTGLHVPLPADTALALCMAMHNGEVIVGGHFHGAGDQEVFNLARWDGAAWNSIAPGGQIGASHHINALTVHEGDLYACGIAEEIGGQLVNRVARWDGAEWQPLVSGSQIGVNAMAFALATYNGELIVAGTFTTAGGLTVNRIARWGVQVDDPFISQPEHTVVAEGELATFSVDVVNSGSVIAYAWRKDGVALADDDRITGANSPMLSIDPANWTDSGVYDVQVRYPCGVRLSTPAALGVTSGPPCPGDLNGDLTVDVLDLLQLLSAWGRCVP